MNVLIATSRGGGLKEDIAKEGLPIQAYVSVGATLDRLNQEILNPKINVIPSSSSSASSPIHAYILGGTNDITILKKQFTRTHIYKECLYEDTIDHTITKIKNNMENLTKSLSDKGAKVIFCTITPFNIAQYNQSLLDDGKTHSLRHQHRYEQMQSQIDEIIETLNNHIIQLNSAKNLTTPLLHRAIMKHHGSRTNRGYWSKNWALLRDGLHGTPDIREAWALSIAVAICKNRDLPIRPKRKSKKRSRPMPNLSDEELGSPKRSWKNEKRPIAKP